MLQVTHLQVTANRANSHLFINQSHPLSRGATWDGFSGRFFRVFGIVVFAAVLLLCVAWCAMLGLCFAFLVCWRRLWVFSEIWEMPVKLQTAVLRASLVFRRGFRDAVGAW